MTGAATRVTRVEWATLALIAAAIVVAIVGLFVDARVLAAAFIAAYAATVSVALGAMGMLMIAHLTTATWFGALRERAELAIGALPALAALAVPQLIAVLWVLRSTHAAPTHAHVVYLQTGFLIARTVVYWIAWLWLATALRATRRILDAGDVDRAVHRFRRISIAGVIILGVTMSFAAFDWMMVLTPDWVSTAYGVYWFAGGLVGALALFALLAARDVPNPVSTPDRRSLGKLFVTFVMFWLYVGFAQYIVIWSGNLPDEVGWYVARTHGWGGVLALILLAGCAILFLTLIQLVFKQSRALLAALGLLALGLHYLDTVWMVMPNLAAPSWWMLAVLASTLVIVVETTLIVGAARVPTP